MWGCLAKVPLPDFKREKIGPKTFNSVFIGYAQNNVAYRFMSLNDLSISESRDAEFFEHVFPLKKNVPAPAHENIHMLDYVPLPASSSGVINLANEPRRSKRPGVETSFGPDFLTSFLIEDFDVNLLSDELVSAFFTEEDPKTYEEAMRSIDVGFLKEAIKSELDFIVSNQTWELVELPKGCNPISSKWIFEKKLRPDGSIDKYKAKLVIKGFN